MAGKAPQRYLSLFSAWALAFGCAVGWDAFILPISTFLPMAGPLGSIVGLVAGGIAMIVIAWNYHWMINRMPGPGGVYSYASACFGSDHGFMCSWFLCLAYMAIVWADTAVLIALAHYAFGHVLKFGFTYEVAGFEVSLGNLVISTAATVATAAICCRRRLAAKVQSIFAVVFILGVIACFAAFSATHPAGFANTLHQPFSSASRPVAQIMMVLAISPWLFIGFESISNLSDEFAFPLKKTFAVMLAAIASSIGVYVMLIGIPVLSACNTGMEWPTLVKSISGNEFSMLKLIANPLGRAGAAVVAAAITGALFTNLIGNTISASRLLCAMSEDGVMPRWVGTTNADGAPRNAIVSIAVIAVVVSALGHTVVNIIVDLAIVGAVVAYAYTSAAALKTARERGSRLGKFCGSFGLVVSSIIFTLFIVQNLSHDTATMDTRSCLVIILWCIAGLASFVWMGRRDTMQRFGRATIVWISLLSIIMVMSVLWIRRTTYDTTAVAFEDIVREHSQYHVHSNESDADDPEFPLDETQLEDWQSSLRDNLAHINKSIVRNSLVQIGLTLLSFALLFFLYSMLRRREHDIELEKAQAKSYFFSTVSHDIRTPLNAIIGFSEMLKSGMKSEAERDQALNSIVISGRTLLSLINDILDLSKLESGKMDIVPEPTNCEQLFTELMRAFHVAGEKPELELRCRVEPMPMLLVDPQRLRQIVFNLIGNAVKFTKKGYVELRASFNRPQDSGTGIFRLAVEDTGCGICESDLKRIGSAYVQVGAKHSRNGGTGLGLAICKQLAFAMGGKLTVKSEQGVGSTFSITIPNVKVAPDMPQDGAAKEVECEKPERRPPANVRRILVVDDSKMNRMVLRALLKSIGDFEIETAVDGRDALEKIKAATDNPFDIVFTDVWMPNMDGCELAREIRSNPALASTRIVAVTADVEIHGNESEQCFDETLLKPLTGEKLASAIHG